MVCSAGTYVRSLCEDIAERLGMLGTMSSLVRTKVENISLEDCVHLEEVNESTELQPMEEVLSGVMPLYEVSSAMLVHVKNGKNLFIEHNSDLLCLTYQNQAVAIAYKDEDVYRVKRGLWG